MSKHTGALVACQQDVVSTPLDHSSSRFPAWVDGQLIQRLGEQLVSGGYTALPTFAYTYYARLGVTAAEFIFISRLCTYWWSTRDPFPGEEEIAMWMRESKRCIQGYIQSLQRKGLLRPAARFSPCRRDGPVSTVSTTGRPRTRLRPHRARPAVRVATWWSLRRTSRRSRPSPPITGPSPPWRPGRSRGWTTRQFMLGRCKQLRARRASCRRTLQPLPEQLVHPGTSGRAGSWPTSVARRCHHLGRPDGEDLDDVLRHRP